MSRKQNNYRDCLKRKRRPKRNETRCPEKYNTGIQELFGVKLRLIVYTEEHFSDLRAKRFMIYVPDGSKQSNQNLWIPNVYLFPDGTIDTSKHLLWLVRKWKNSHNIELAGYMWHEECLSYKASN